MEGIRGTQEARDAKNDKDRQKEGEKTNDKQERKKTLEFSEAILKAAKDVDTERRVRELVELASKRMQMAERTETERRVSAEVAGRSLSEMA